MIFVSPPSAFLALFPFPSHQLFSSFFPVSFCVSTAPGVSVVSPGHTHLEAEAHKLASAGASAGGARKVTTAHISNTVSLQTQAELLLSITSNIVCMSGVQLII